MSLHVAYCIAGFRREVHAKPRVALVRRAIGLAPVSRVEHARRNSDKLGLPSAVGTGSVENVVACQDVVIILVATQRCF